MAPGGAGALGLLAIAYDSGKIGLRPDAARAVELYRRAASLGNSGAMRRLGRAYARAELGLVTDLARAETCAPDDLTVTQAQRIR